MTQKLFLIVCAAFLVACPESTPDQPDLPSGPDKPADTPSSKPLEAKPGDEGHNLIEVNAGSSNRDIEARGLQLFALGKLDEAVTLLTPAAADKTNLGAQRLLAMVFLRQGDAASAKPYVDAYAAHPGAQKPIVDTFNKRIKQLEGGGKGTFNHDPFTSILKEAVKGIAVDYTVVEARAADLELYLRAVADADAGALTGDEQLAFFTNAYNAWVLRAVMNNKLYDPNGKKGVQEVDGFFDKVGFPVAGQEMTLNELEEKKLRPPNGPAEVHFAVNCASVSCPPLRNAAYSGADFKAAIDAQTRDYLKRDVTVDKAKKTISVVKLFEWYEKDFGGKAGVRAFLAKHGVAAAKDASYKIVTKPYDWRLNKVR